jgi:hypothetical protein
MQDKDEIAAIRFTNLAMTHNAPFNCSLRALPETSPGKAERTVFYPRLEAAPTVYKVYFM